MVVCYWDGENWAGLGDAPANECLEALQRQPDTAICQYAPSAVNLKFLFICCGTIVIGTSNSKPHRIIKLLVVL